MVAIFLLLALTLAWSQAPCTHYAAANGSGSACSQSQPCKVGSWWSQAGPGTTLCLLPGDYRGGDSMLVPPQQLAGQEGRPITIRARDDGTVLIDAQHGGMAVWLSGTDGGQNHWFVVEGINATNGLEKLIRVSGNNNTLRRVIGWNGTSGQNDSNIFHLTGQHNWCEDCAGWGANSRKIMNMSQGGNVGGGGYLRGWAEWNDHPQGASKPNNTWLVSYNTGNARFFNVIGTWDTKGEVAGAEGIMEVARQCDGELDAEGTQVKGALMYVRPGATYQPGQVVSGFCASNFYLEDVAALVPQGYHAAPFAFFKGSSVQPSGSVCQNCLGVHGGSPSRNESNSGWTMPGFREGSSLSAATGGQHLMTLQPGLCRRYDRSGTLTNQPLWPWPMNARIKAAREQSGYGPTDVTASVEAALGPIPAACKGEGPPPVTDTTPPIVAIVAPSDGALVSGTAVSVLAEATDNVAVVGVQWIVNGSPHGAEERSLPWGYPVDTTVLPNGAYTLQARARDAANNTATSAPVRVVVYNGPTPIPPTPDGTHPPLRCSGALQDAGRLDLACVPVVTPPVAPSRIPWER